MVVRQSTCSEACCSAAICRTLLSSARFLLCMASANTLCVACPCLRPCHACLPLPHARTPTLTRIHTHTSYLLPCRCCGSCVRAYLIALDCHEPLWLVLRSERHHAVRAPKFLDRITSFVWTVWTTSWGWRTTASRHQSGSCALYRKGCQRYRRINSKRPLRRHTNCRRRGACTPWRGSNKCR